MLTNARRALTLVVLVTLVAPSFALAQTGRAGIVTTLEGTVTARRVALPDPVPLKFKDDVFLQDTVTTGDRSLARMLLGGKAVVTVRERSVLTITEVPGRSTIELDSGKFALAVAREKMRPGEEILIRTPNAIAGVRGTVVITEVARPGANVVTNFSVIRGTVTVQQIDPTSRAPIGAVVSLGALQAYIGAGSAAPRVAPMTPDDVKQSTSGLTPTGPKGGSEAGQEQAKGQAIQTTATLLSTITGTTVTDATGSQVALATAPTPPSTGGSSESGSTSSSTAKTSTAPLTPLTMTNTATEVEKATSELSALIESIALLSGSLKFAKGVTLETFIGTTSVGAGDPIVTFSGGTLIGLDDLIFFGPSANLTTAAPLARVMNSTLLADGAVVGIEGATVTSTTTDPFISFDPVSVVATDEFFFLEGGTLKLAGPLFKDTGGTLVLGGAVLSLDDGATMTSTTGSALISLSRSAVTSTQNILRIAGNSSLALRGTLLDATDSMLKATSSSFSFMPIVDGASVTVTGTNDPLLKFTGTASGLSQATAARNFLVLAFSATSASPSLTLSGPLLSATRTDFKSGDSTANTFSHLFIADGAQVKSTSTSPLLTYTDSTVDSAGNIVGVRRSTATTPTRLTLAGPLLSATNSTFNHTTLGFGTAFGTAGSACCNAFSIQQGAQLSSSTTSALIQLTGSTVTGADAQSGGSFFRVGHTFGGAPSTELVAPGIVSLAGPLLAATNSTITALFDIVSVDNATLTSTTSAALISLTGSTVKAAAATNPFSSTAPFGSPVGLFSDRFFTSVTLAGPLLAAKSSTITGSALFDLVNLANGSKFTSTTTQPLVQLDGSTLALSSSFTNTGFSAFSAASCPSTGCIGLNSDNTFSTISVKGPLLSAVNGSSVNTTGSLVRIGNGGELVVTGSTDPLISLSGGTHTLATNTFSGTFPSPIFHLTGRSTATAVETADGVSLTLGVDQPIKHVGGLLEGANGATISGQRGVRLDTALLEATAPLLSLKSGSSLTVTVNALDLIQKAKLTSIGPLVKLDASTLTVSSGPAANVISGSLLKVTGDLFSLSNGSTLKMLNGPALNVGGNSVVNITGSLVNFGGSGGNAVSITNTLCGTSCTSIGGLNVFLTGGATSSNVTIHNPIKNSSLGAVTLSNPSATAVIQVSGTSSKVTISGN